MFYEMKAPTYDNVKRKAKDALVLVSHNLGLPPDNSIIAAVLYHYEFCIWNIIDGGLIGNIVYVSYAPDIKPVEPKIKKETPNWTKRRLLDQLHHCTTPKMAMRSWRAM